MNPTTTTLGDRVHAILRNNDNDDLLLIAHELARDDGELDVADWGLIVGLAYGIARGEDPYENHRSVTLRAEAAAREALSRWTTPSSIDAEVK